MEGFMTSALAAIWLGILTSVSPCPLATNIAAVSYLGKQINNTRGLLLSGLCYTLGRVTAYASLGAIVVGSVLAIPDVSNFLQKYMNKILGPILIIAGMFLLGLFSFSFGQNMGHERAKGIAEKSSLIGSFILGLLFALAFCPISAALFFGALVPLAVKQSSTVILPLLYGAGTALPVVIFAVLLEISIDVAAKAFHKLTAFEIRLRRVTGAVFILVGIYFSLTFIFKIQMP